MYIPIFYNCIMKLEHLYLFSLWFIGKMKTSYNPLGFKLEPRLTNYVPGYGILVTPPGYLLFFFGFWLVHELRILYVLGIFRPFSKWSVPVSSAVMSAVLHRVLLDTLWSTGG